MQEPSPKTFRRPPPPKQRLTTPNHPSFTCYRAPKPGNPNQKSISMSDTYYLGSPETWPQKSIKMSKICTQMPIQCTFSTFSLAFGPNFSERGGGGNGIFRTLKCTLGASRFPSSTADCNAGPLPMIGCGPPKSVA